MCNRFSFAPALVAGLCSGSALAVTSAGSGSTIVIPVTASTGSYTSEVSVFYPGPFSGSGTSMTINVLYYEANGQASPGPKPCTPLSINAGETKSFLLASQCTLGTGGHFGLLVLQDAAAEKVNYFFAFNRTESVGNHIGFSIEGFPIGNFSGQTANVSGIKRVAAAPGFQTNCFVGSLGESVDYQIDLRDSAGNPLGVSVNDTLGPWQLTRYLDIFGAVGAAPGDYVNARARFSVTNPSALPALIGFCTVQDQTLTGADFRIAKSRDAVDNGQRRVSCRAGNSDCTDVGASPFQITDVTRKDGYRLLVHSPDFVKCTILGSQAASLELALLPIGSFNPGGTVLAGGTGQHSFYYDTGPRSTQNNGIDEFFNLEVQTIAAAPAGTYDYSIRCDSGNGTGNTSRVNSGTARGF
jgi:hypothetical protein